MPTFLASCIRSSFERSSYLPALPPFLLAWLPLEPAFALAIRAAFSLLAPLSRKASYCLSSFTEAPWFFAIRRAYPPLSAICDERPGQVRVLVERDQRRPAPAADELRDARVDDDVVERHERCVG